jgi:uncharacterized protein YbcC (UPF0753/DUF2309 family)
MKTKNVKELLLEIARYLPAQGPVKTFVHHNTLHHLEDLSFYDAVQKAANIYGANFLLSEEKYQEFYKNDRIDQADLNKILAYEKVETESWILEQGSKRKFLRYFLVSAPPNLTAETLCWRFYEKNYLSKFIVKPNKFKSILAQDSQKISKANDLVQTYKKIVSKQDWLLKIADLSENDIEKSLALLWMAAVVTASKLELKTNTPVKEIYSSSKYEELINPYLVKFTASFLDVGLAHLNVSDRSRGLFECFIEHMQNNSFVTPPWLAGSYKEYKNKNSTEIIEEILEKKSIEDWHAYLLQKALILKGWAGLVYKSEKGIAGVPTRGNLTDFLAIRLILEEHAENYFKNHPGQEALSDLLFSEGNNQAQEANEKLLSNLLIQAFHLFICFQRFGVSGLEIFTLNHSAQEELVKTIQAFPLNRRLEIWHKAYEWNLYSRTATALQSNFNEEQRKTVAKCQIVCCIDDREESFRRYLEEINSDYQTFGTAGFFGVDAEFHSIYEMPVALCPVNIIPTHHVNLIAKSGSEQRHLGMRKMIKFKSDLGVLLEVNSRSLFRGWLLALGGLLALVPLSIATISPRWMHKFKYYLKKILLNPNDESSIVYADEEGEVGRYTLEEMCIRVIALLKTTGLANQLAPLVVITGHGSFSTNNPYRSAYDCGACGGRPGRLNSRVFASMANRSDVREQVKNAGVNIPEETHFLAAYHNTCTDEVEYFDLDQLPDTHRKLFEKLKTDIEIARAQNALERCRRFDEVNLNRPDYAIAHVESRSHHIAQPRPEYGHATNALCIVGRREITKGLFFDRRAFLVSYDPSLDTELLALRNLLRAVIPVCMGINLEYFFSSIDNQKYGAGSKLPHNVTSLLGIMTGYCSDLRTGLPVQMIEIHEPTRLLIVIEQSVANVQKFFELEPELHDLFKKGWVSLMVNDVQQKNIYYYNPDYDFEKIEQLTSELYTVKSSLDWIIGKSDHLDFVRVRA